MDLLRLVIKLWDTWNLRGVIILSLSLQTFLILFGTLRKRTANTAAIMFIWIAYLLADWAASFAVGLISKAQGATPPHDADNADLLAFWAPFLLLHLGGPDTITAFSLEDNELWLRHFLGLSFQVMQNFQEVRFWLWKVGKHYQVFSLHFLSKKRYVDSSTLIDHKPLPGRSRRLHLFPDFSRKQGSGPDDPPLHIGHYQVWGEDPSPVPCKFEELPRIHAH